MTIEIDLDTINSAAQLGKYLTLLIQDYCARIGKQKSIKIGKVFKGVLEAGIYFETGMKPGQIEKTFRQGCRQSKR